MLTAILAILIPAALTGMTAYIKRKFGSAINLSRVSAYEQIALDMLYLVRQKNKHNYAVWDNIEFYIREIVNMLVDQGVKRDTAERIAAGAVGRFVKDNKPINGR